jgi:outer membrane lipoprotein-sorting protein
MRTLAIVLATAVVSTFLSAPPSRAADSGALTASQIVDKLSNAIRCTNLTSEIETYSTIIDGKYATVTMMIKRPDRYYERINIPQDQASTTMGILGSSVWIQQPNGQVTTASLGDSNIGADVISMLWSPETWLKISRGADRSYRGVTYDVLHVTSVVNRGSDDVLVDPKTFYPAGVQFVWRGTTLNIEYRDFTESSGGLMYPRHIAVVGPDGSTLHIFTITSLDVNVHLDDSQFEVPQ